jgi:hypothetical protein
MRARGRLPWILALLLAAAGGPARAAPSAPEVQLKAAFIFHFTQFIDWPAGTFGGPDAPFVIGVLGDEPMDDALTLMVRGERLSGHPLAVRRIRSTVEAADCQIVYVPADADDSFREARLRGAPVLTVGETADFLQAGGIIEFFTDHSHVRLRINLAAAHGASLRISSKLLRVAQVLSPP